MANGLYTNEELVDTLIIDLNNLPKHLIDGQFIQFCNTVTQMGQKLINLRSGIKQDLDNKNQIIETLKENIRNLGVEVKEMSVEEIKDLGKDGAGNGE